MSVTIQLRGDTAANWTSVNPVLAAREAGIETDTGRIKVGNGTAAWSTLPYWSGGTWSGSGQALVGVAPAVVSLADNTVVAVNAASGNYFRIALTTAVGSTRTVNAPSGATDGQLAVFEIIQPASGGPLGVSWATGAGGFSFGTGSAPVLDTVASSSTLISFRYSGAAQVWECLTSGGSSGLVNVATTGSAGYPLGNGTGTILSWTAPADGQMHRAQVFASEVVTSAMTGGEITVTWSEPGGTSVAWGVLPPASSTGWNYGISQVPPMLVEPGSTVTVAQSTAMTAGAAIVQAEIWAA